jgi:hypothetical protein
VNHTERKLRERLAILEERSKAERRLSAERDRRYAEVETERRIAREAQQRSTAEALILARDAQAHRDEQMNHLREQLEQERGRYLTRDEYVVQHQALVDRMEQGWTAHREVDDRRFEAQSKALESAVANISETIKPLTEFVLQYRGAQSSVVDRRMTATQRSQITYSIIAGCAGLAAIIAAVVAVFH